jgi:hypothetical protein
MGMKFSYTVEVEVERIQGKFASRDEIEEFIRLAVEGAESDIDLSGIGADGDSEYEVVSFEVERKR